MRCRKCSTKYKTILSEMLRKLTILVENFNFIEEYLNNLGVNVVSIDVAEVFLNVEENVFATIGAQLDKNLEKLDVPFEEIQSELKLYDVDYVSNNEITIHI